MPVKLPLSQARLCSPPLLPRGLLQARDLRYRQRSCIMEGAELVVEVKGPGQVVGEVFMQDLPPPCRYSARARGDVLALKLTQENYVRALAAMYYEAENGARAVATSTTASGRPLPGPSASSPGLLGAGMGSSSTGSKPGASSSTAAAAAAGGAAAAGDAVSPTAASVPGVLLPSGGSGPSSIGGSLSAPVPPVPVSPPAAAAAASAGNGGSAAGCAAAANARSLLAAAGSSAGSRVTGGTGGLSSSTLGDSTAPLSMTHTASSGGSLLGPNSQPAKAGSARIGGGAVAGAAADGAGGTMGSSEPLQLLAVGSDEATDEETGPGA